jgi:K+-transporting ATPase ATPase C chain
MTAPPPEPATSAPRTQPSSRTIQNALDQAPRVAQARHLLVASVLALLHQHTAPAQWGFLSEPDVNVLQLNLALDGER